MPQDSVAEFDGWCNTYEDKVTYRLKWTIHNFWSISRKSPINSSTFTVKVNNEVTEWYAILYPYGRRDNNMVIVDFYLKSCSNEFEGHASSFAAVLDKNGSQTEVNELARSTGFRTMGQNGFSTMEIFSINRRMLQEKLGKVTSDRGNPNLNLLCELIILIDPLSITEKSSHRLTERLQDLSTSFGNIVDSKKYSDVIIQIGDQEIAAHKNILAARSEVFASMFDNEMLESTRGRVEIKDIEYETFKELLTFIYSGKTENLNKMAKELLFAADKYALTKLKDMCEEALCQQLTVENVCELSLFADRHSCKRLHAQTLDFIIFYLSKVTKTEGFALLKSQPNIFGTIFTKMESTNINKQ